MATVNAIAIATQGFDDTILDDYTLNIANIYGINPNDVTPIVKYEATGSMIISIPESVTEEDIVDTLTSSIADALDIHPSNVAVNIDLDSGEVEFVIATEEFNEALGVQFDLEKVQTQNEIINSIENVIPSATIEEYNISNDVTAMIEFTVDANESNNDLTQAAWKSEQLLSDFDVTVESKYLTYSPTFFPSKSPTTSIPTRSPSLTGLVGIIELSKSVNKSIDDHELDNIQTEIIEAYGVDVEDIIIEVLYQTKGFIDVDFDVDANIEELEEAMELEIATTLGIHEGNVEVNMQDGVATYTITSDSIDSIRSIQDTLDDPASAAILDEALPISIGGINPDDDIIADIVVTVDASGASNNLNTAAALLADTFEENGYDTNVESNFEHNQKDLPFS